MSLEQNTVRVDDFHKLIEDRAKWQQALAGFAGLARLRRRRHHHVTTISGYRTIGIGGNSPLPVLFALAHITSVGVLWELTVVASAYVLFQPNEFPRHEGRSDLYSVIYALNSISGRHSLPDFAEFATRITPTPFRTLIRSAPRLTSVLSGAQMLTASSLVCIDYCMKSHPYNGAAFLQCVESC